MGPIRLILFATVVAIAVASLASLFGHLFLNGEPLFPGGILLGAACGIGFAIYLNRSSHRDSHN